jgi:hypothetical protein
MGDFARSALSGVDASIIRPRMEANNFEIKPNIIQMIQQSIQFGGLTEKDPNAHIASFLEIYDTF